MDFLLPTKFQSQSGRFNWKYGWSNGLLGWEKLEGSRRVGSRCLYICCGWSCRPITLLNLGMVWRLEDWQRLSHWIWARTSECQHLEKRRRRFRTRSYLLSSWMEKRKCKCVLNLDDRIQPKKFKTGSLIHENTETRNSCLYLLLDSPCFSWSYCDYYRARTPKSNSFFSLAIKTTSDGNLQD